MPKLSFATTWINTFDDCPSLERLPLRHCDDVANGFGEVMKVGGHTWAINLKEKEAKPEDWMYRNARLGYPCDFRGNDAAPGRGVDTVDFAIIVTHGGAEKKTSDYPAYASVFFNKRRCRFCSTKTRFGDGKLKWVVLDCCNSLTIDMSGDPDARHAGITPWVVWRHSFHGLHTMFGFNGASSDAWWTRDRGKAFALSLVASDAELADAWIDAAYSYQLDDIPVAATAGRDAKDGDHRLETERLSSSFDSIPNREVKFLEWMWRGEVFSPRPPGG